MSRTIHKTVKGVFGGKSAKEMNQMLEENDPDVQELGQKYAYKNSKREQRMQEKQLNKLKNDQ